MSDAYDFSLHQHRRRAAACCPTFKGKPVLVVNTASKCGLTPQYEGLEKPYSEITATSGLGGPRRALQPVRRPGARGTEAEIKAFALPGEVRHRFPDDR